MYNTYHVLHHAIDEMISHTMQPIRVIDPRVPLLIMSLIQW